MRPQGEAPWLTKEQDLAAASAESLRRSLLTSDGMGAAFKLKCLQELLRRETAEQEKPQ